MAEYRIIERGTDFVLIDEQGHIITSHYDPDAFNTLVFSHTRPGDTIICSQNRQPKEYYSK